MLRRRTTALLAGITFGLGGAGVAEAQIPGALDTGTVVITTSDALDVTVDETPASSTQATGSIRNSTGNAFRCATPGVGKTGQSVDFPGQVTEADIVARSMRFYSLNVFQPVGGFRLDVQLPSGSTLNTLDFGSMIDYFPTGSLVIPLGETRAEYLNIQDAQDKARIKGHTGDPKVGGSIAFDVRAGESVRWSAALGTPASGIRTDFNAAAMFYCRDTTSGLHYVFAGYEAGTTPPAT